MNHYLDWLFDVFTMVELVSMGVIIVLSIILSIVTNNILLPRLRKRAARTQSVYQRMLFKSLKGETIIWILGIAALLIVEIIYLSGEINDRIFEDIQRAIILVIVFSILWFIKDLSDEIIRYYARKGTIPRSSLFINIIKFTIVIIVLMAILDSFGISVTSIITALGIGGLALALALQDTLSNVISGLTIITAGQIKQGEYIELETGEAGYVRDISWRNTTIETLDQEMVIIPNTKLSNTTILNTNQPLEELLLRVHIGVDYGSDLELVEEVTLDVARRIVKQYEGGVETFEPRLLYHEFADSSINFSVMMKVRNFDARRILKHHFIKAISKEYEAHDIDIPFPIRTIKMDK